jgi:hypothetical protein
MVEFNQVDDEVNRALSALADQVLQSLKSTGLPVFHSNAGEDLSGAEIEVDRGDDAAGGVYVSWRPDSQLVNDASDALLQGRLDDPVIRKSGAIKVAMKDAIGSVLAIFGFVVEDSGDDMRPVSVRVIRKVD